MSEPFIGQIMPMAFDFAPRGWAFCNGAELYIQQYDALFKVIGVKYGGDGTNVFNLPDLRGRIPIGTGLAPDQINYQVGNTGGSETVTLDTSQIMAHTHQAMADRDANEFDPANNVWAGDSSGSNPYYTDTQPTGTDTLRPTAIGTAGGRHGVTQPHNNMPPVAVVNYIIAITGLYPSNPS